MTLRTAALAGIVIALTVAACGGDDSDDLPPTTPRQAVESETSVPTPTEPPDATTEPPPPTDTPVPTILRYTSRIADFVCDFLKDEVEHVPLPFGLRPDGVCDFLTDQVELRLPLPFDEPSDLLFALLAVSAVALFWLSNDRIGKVKNRFLRAGFVASSLGSVLLWLVALGYLWDVLPGWHLWRAIEGPFRDWAEFTLKRRI